MYRRFVYRHKKDTERFGLLEAVNYNDAKRHLGGGFFIRTAWFPEWLTYGIMFDHDEKRGIVDMVFDGKIAEIDRKFLAGIRKQNDEGV